MKDPADDPGELSTQKPCPMAEAHEEHTEHGWTSLKAGGPFYCPGFDVTRDRIDTGNHTITATADHTIVRAGLAAGAVTSEQIAANSIKATHLRAGSIGIQPLADNERFIVKTEGSDAWAGPFPTYEAAHAYLKSRGARFYTIARLVTP